jgi:hypothetical protein
VRSAAGTISRKLVKGVMACATFCRAGRAGQVVEHTDRSYLDGVWTRSYLRIIRSKDTAHKVEPGPPAGSTSCGPVQGGGLAAGTDVPVVGSRAVTTCQGAGEGRQGCLIFEQKLEWPGCSCGDVKSRAGTTGRRWGHLLWTHSVGRFC